MPASPANDPQKPFRPPKAVRESLLGIWRGLKRCLDRYPPIFHELWEPQLTLDLAMPELFEPVSMNIGGSSVVICDVPSIPSIGDSFRKAYKYEMASEWSHWHEPDGGRFFGCFYGKKDTGFADFNRLSESAYLVLRHVKPELPYDIFHGWIKILHEMAHGHPTPLLRSSSWIWLTSECQSDEDHERWIKPEQGAPYPQHPIQRTLKHDVVTSSMAAIELILDDERALLVGRHQSFFPVSFPGREVELPKKLANADQETSSAVRSESSTKGPVILFERRGGEWYFEFDTGHGIVKRPYLIRGKGFVGFEICKYLLSKPDTWIEWEDIFKETGQAEKLKGAFTQSRQKRGDEDSTPFLNEGESRLMEEYEHTHELAERARLWKQIQEIGKEKRGSKRAFSEDNTKFATQIQAQRNRAIDEIRKVFSELAEYLDERMFRDKCRFIYARDDGLYQILAAGRS